MGVGKERRSSGIMDRARSLGPQRAFASGEFLSSLPSVSRPPRGRRRHNCGQARCPLPAKGGSGSITFGSVGLVLAAAVVAGQCAGAMVGTGGGVIEHAVVG